MTCAAALRAGEGMGVCEGDLAPAHETASTSVGATHLATPRTSYLLPATTRAPTTGASYGGPHGRLEGERMASELDRLGARRLRRRDFMRYAGITAGAGVLAACKKATST